MSNHFKKTLQYRLRGVNLSALARQLSISKKVLHDWVHTSKQPSLKNIHQVKQLANFLGMSFEELLLGSPQDEVLASVQFQDGTKTYRVKIEKIPNNDDRKD